MFGLPLHMIFAIVFAVTTLSWAIFIYKPGKDELLAESELGGTEQKIAAKVIAKTDGAASDKRVLFESENRERMIFHITDGADFDALAVGDVGVLTYSGTKFIGFESKIG